MKCTDRKCRIGINPEYILYHYLLIIT